MRSQPRTHPRRCPRRSSPRAFEKLRWAALCLSVGFGSAFAGDGPEPTPDRPVFSPSLIYDGAAFVNADGGRRHSATYSGDLNLRLYIDPGPRAGVADVFGYVDALWIHGGQPSTLLGDAQGVSNISAPGSVGLYEAWIQKNSFADRLSVLVGLYDLNSEFYRLQTAALFLNSSFGIGPEFAQSGSAGPSIFPRTAGGARATFQPGDFITLRTAILNGAPFERDDGRHSLHESGDGALIVAEVSLIDRFRGARQRRSQRFRIGRNASEPSHDNKIALGVWHYTARLPDAFDRDADGAPLLRHGSSGYYVIGESLLHVDPDRADRRISGFVQAGYGDRRVDRFGTYAGAGLVMAGLMPSRSDELGLAVAVARNGSHFMNAQSRNGLQNARAERSIELSYLLPVNAHLALQPDLQFVHRPNTDPNVRDAVALQLRFELSY